MGLLALKNLARRRLRSALTLCGVAVSVAVMACLLAFGQGYQAGLGRELDRMGVQLMLVPLGCPYDGAARVLKGRALEESLPASALERVRRDPDVAVAAPLLLAAVPRPEERRTDLWVGLDRSALALKPWWQLTPGSAWFDAPDDVILGAEAAETELRAPGDRFYLPGGRGIGPGRALRVRGVLERSGTTDDSLFFLPLATAQALFGRQGRLSAVAVRLKDPARGSEVAERLQEVPGAQVVTMTEMLGTFLNLVGSVRTLVFAVGIVAVAVSALSVFNTMLASVLERTAELGVMRAVGASRAALFRLVAAEALALALAGGALGLALAAVAGRWVEATVKGFIPLAPAESILMLTGPVAAQCVLLAIATGIVAGSYPAWRASRLGPAEALREA
jgi:putative ABC transport system permease protein